MTTVCGKCVCEVVTTVPTLPSYSTELCTMYNTTHALCNYYGGMPSTYGMFIFGVIVGGLMVCFLYVIYKLFYDENRDKKIM